ncbi:hypothetical protein D9M72_185930 [compost metagenome]
MNLTVLSIWIPPDTIIANIIRPAPPSTGCGIVTTNAPSTGNSPASSSMTPVSATTWRLATPVSETTPTFCAKVDNGGLDTSAAKAEPKPSHRMPRDRHLPEIGRCVAAPSAMNVPVDSTMVTRKAIDMATMPEMGNDIPKCSGCGTAMMGAW